MLPTAILLRYHEIALKGANRGWFEERLAQNAKKLVQRALGPSCPLEFSRLHGRVLLTAPWDDITLKATCDALSRVFGVTSFSPMRVVPTDLSALASAAVAEFKAFLETNPFPKTFRVLTRRSDKAIPMTSMEIDRHVGMAVHDVYPELKVDLENPEVTIAVEIRFERSYIGTLRIKGPGGLPVGTGGNVLTLLSGGLDSPVAAIRMIKRGAVSAFIHFHGAPFVGEDVLHKVRDLAQAINRFQPDPQPLYVVPFGKIQETIAVATNPKLRTLLYRRMMVRVSAALGRQYGAHAIVTGDNLGQVASQTIENIQTVHAVTPETLVFRPLIAFDKEEIIESARDWGTYDISIRPGADCCTLFADRHPSIRASLAVIEEQEAPLPIQELVVQALDGIQTIRP